MEELVIPTDLKAYLSGIAEGRNGFTLGEPWKYSEDALGVIVPIIRENSPDREYVTMYEVLKELNIKDTGHISQIELQNKTGMAVFIRAGTIFTGSTQNRAAQHSGVYKDKEQYVDVRCVHQSHGIRAGSNMQFGDISPPSITVNLMGGDQSSVWRSVRNYTGDKSDRDSDIFRIRNSQISFGLGNMTSYRQRRLESRSNMTCGTSRSSPVEYDLSSDNLLGHIQNIKNGQSMIDDMMQKVPLFNNQVGAVLFNPVGLIALETFDNPKSWEAIKKEIIEKFGDKINPEQAEHLYELKKEMIVPSLKKFISRMDKMSERTIRKDDLSETREIKGDNIIGEYTIVKGQPIHVLLMRNDL